MKIKEINLKNHPVLKDIDINISGKERSLNTTVLAGVNGSGKTTLLRTVFEIMTNVNNDFIESFVELEEINFAEELSAKFDFMKFNRRFNKNGEVINTNEEKTVSNLLNNLKENVVYLPTEVNFDNLNVKNDNYKVLQSFGCIINQSFINDIPSYIATKYRIAIFKNRNMTAGETIDKISEEINKIFHLLDIDVKIIGLSEDEKMIPLFSNIYGGEFDINALSSGEKQIFVRMMTLKMLDINNSIILVDEPELSLHPKWQQKIVKLYESIGINNQIIIATHSPHVVSSVKSECLRIFVKGRNGIEILNGDEIGGGYGYPVERVLVEVMGLDTVRDPDIDKAIKELQQMVRENSYDTEEFKIKYRIITDIVGTIDEDIILLNMSIARRRGGTYAENR